MPTKNYAGTFKAAVNRGTPAWQAVNNIATKSKQTETWVWNHLFSRGVVCRRKINGSFIYWPNWQPGRSANKATHKPWNWQNIINWAITSGYCTPDQIDALKSQKDFFNFFGPFFAQQFGWKVSSGWTKSQVNNWYANGSPNGARTTGKSSTSKRRGGSKSKRRTSSTAHSRKRKSTKRTVKSGTKRNVRRRTRHTRRPGAGFRSYRFPKSGTRAYSRAA